MFKEEKEKAKKLAEIISSYRDFLGLQKIWKLEDIKNEESRKIMKMLLEERRYYLSF